MMLLTATRVDERGRFKYVVERDQDATLESEELAEIVDILKKSGVQTPYRFIAHAEQWGLIEIPWS